MFASIILEGQTSSEPLSDFMFEMEDAREAEQPGLGSLLMIFPVTLIINNNVLLISHVLSSYSQALC